MSTLSAREIADAQLADWTFLSHSLHTRLATGDFATGLAIVDQIGAAAEAAGHHPDLDLRYPHLDIRLSSHDAGGVTDRDVALARSISDLAAAAGVQAERGVSKILEVALDTPDADRVRPFWQAILGMEAKGGEGFDAELVDDVLPALWFQHSGSAEPRQRFHLDVWVAPEVAEDRVADTIAAGGVLVSDAEAPSFWVLADADGNRACVCTSLSRGSD